MENLSGSVRFAPETAMIIQGCVAFAASPASTKGPPLVDAAESGHLHIGAAEAVNNMKTTYNWKVVN